MTLWFVFALMTAAAIFAVLLPLGRRGAAQADAGEVAVYKDQLSEIDRDLSLGLIGSSEGEAARVEIGRRLLAASEGTRNPAMISDRRWRRGASILALVGVPALAISLYVPLGSPQLGDFPLSQRVRAPDANQPVEALVAQVEAHLEKNSSDGRGWSVLAPVLTRLGRYDDAIRAYRNSITYNGDNADCRADLGEAIVASAGGVVTAEAKTEFEHALALNADEPKARYFLGVAAEQDGRAIDAATIWRSMLEEAPAEATWRPLVQAALARVEGSAAPGLPDEAVTAAKNLNETERTAMIRGMVERLATRLKQNGDDVDGWLRLVRAYVVLGNHEKAQTALEDARQAVGNDSGRLQRLNEGLKSLGVGG